MNKTKFKQTEIGEIPEGWIMVILGSFPSPLSLKQREYYGNPRNHFWMIMAELLQEPFPTDYERKTQMLLKHGVALWDVIATCQRRGAADVQIEEPTIDGRFLL